MNYLFLTAEFEACEYINLNIVTNVFINSPVSFCILYSAFV